MLALKIEFPNDLFLIRGNHESRDVSSFFGFKEECERKYGRAVYNRALACFQSMPLGILALLPNQRFLCVHGGISPNFTELRQLEDIDRFAEPPMNGLLCDVLWADPIGESSDLRVNYAPNPKRGVSYRFSNAALQTFLKRNSLSGIIRGHEVVESGYALHHVSECESGLHQLVTVFSAPNYCRTHGNLGAYLRLGYSDGKIMDFVQFNESPVQDDDDDDESRYENECERQGNLILAACPYMPTTFNGFIRLALELSEICGRAGGEVSHASSRFAGAMDHDGINEMHPSMILHNFNEASAKVNDAEEQAGTELSSTSISLPRPESVKRLSRRSSSSTHEIFVTGRRRKSVKLMRRRQSSSSFSSHSLISSLASPQCSSLKRLSGMSGSRAGSMARTRTSTRSSSSKLVSPKESDNDVASLKTISFSETEAFEFDDIFGPVPESEEDGPMFTRQEILGLQMLFLIMTRNSKKEHLDGEDLVQWSAEDGSSICKSEAEAALKAVDEDQDGHIGLEDFLLFAAKAREVYHMTLYNGVLDELLNVRRRASTTCT